MDKREKVIKGMEELRSHFRAMAGIASSNQGRANHIGSARIIGDAIDLLKAQEPRVMTPTEIAALKENDIVWYEQHGTDGDFLAAMVADGREFIGNASMGVKLRYLDQNERLWTSRPTDEQRAATPWKAVTS